MRKLAIGIMLIFLNVGFGNASTTTLSWDPSPTPEVTGYKIYYNLDSTALPFNGTGAFEGNSPIDVGNVLTFTLNDLLLNSKYYFSVTAYDASNNESSYSNIVSNEKEVPDLDGSWDASDGIFLGSDNLVTVEVTSPLDKYLKKFEGVVTKGEVTCIKLSAHFNGNTIADIYVKDQGSNEVISSQSAIFIDEEYGSHDICVVYQKNSTEAELFIDFGRDPGIYEFQKMIVTTSIPEHPPVQDFWLSHMSEASLSGAVYDDNWEWTPPTPSPDSYRVVIAKTLKGVLGLDSETLYVDMPIVNIGQSTLENFTVTFDLELNGYFIALSAIYGENESAPVIKTHLPGNILGTADNENPTLFRNIIVDRVNDWMTVYGFYRTRANIPIPGGEPASPEERASMANYPYIIRYDYSYARGREYYKLLMH